MIGKTIAHYEVNSKIGKGGMGEVYQAKDTKLGRDVAIKVLPEEFAQDSNRVARFQREAKLLASLNHPNIAAIYGLEEAEDIHFLVMELIEGQTLAERIKGGPFPVEEALKLALQITEALEAAHEKGVIHRDLKPANIKVTPDGKVKVLDFGLAKAYAGDSESMNLSNSPTLSQAMTMQGVILGTAAYMSPEQARGKTVDKRADVWAFGAVLYEMLTGRQAFQGEDVSETLASVIKGDTNLNLLPSNFHQRIREVISRCLQKELRKRYPDIANARYEIEQVLADPSGVFAQPSAITKPRKKLRLGLPWVSAIAILSIIVAGVGAWYLKPTELRQITEFTHDLPENQQFGSLYSPVLAISPDGSKFVYCTTEGLYLRSMDARDAKIISGTDESPHHPFFSPDGQWIGYWSASEQQLKKIGINGGSSVKLCDSNTPMSPVWGIDDTIVFSQRGQGIMKVSAKGGKPELLIPREGEPALSPQILPNGKSVLFSILEDGEPQIAVQLLGATEPKILIPGGLHARYLSTGHLVYGVGNSLYAVVFDPEGLKVTSGPVPMVEDILWLGEAFAMQYAVSDSGMLAYIQSDSVRINERTLVWVDREGKEELISAPPKDYRGPQISPDGTKVALTINTNGNQDIWVWDLIRENQTRVTLDEAADNNPIWTPDGEKIIFSSERDDGLGSLYWKAANGRGDPKILFSMPNNLMSPVSISDDGNLLLVQELQSQSVNISMISIEGESTRELLLKEDYQETLPEISPDGRWMAYVSNESGQYEIYICPFPDVNKDRWPVSTKGGESPLWSPDGRDLFYRTVDAVMAVAVETEPELKLGRPKVLFPGRYVTPDPLNWHPWDIHPNGKRFLMIKQPETTEDVSTQGSPRKIIIVTNWFEKLKEKAPVQ